MTALVETRTLALRAGQRTLLADLDWRVSRGEFWCVLGRNGAGKSTLLHVLSALRRPDAGEVRIDGQPVGAMAPLALARQRGLMPQQTLDSFSFSVREAVAIGRTPWRLGSAWDSEQDEGFVHAALAQVGMQGRIDDDILSLSGGERQRVAFAALLAQQPALMLLDEPTAHQDVAQQLLLMRLMQRLAERHALIMTCHDINLAARFATHVLLLGPGFHLAGPVSTVLTTDSLQRVYGCEFARAGDATAASFIAR